MPFVPFLPILSVFINFYLMSQLNTATWIRFAVWMVLGFIIYFAYGVTNSSEVNQYQKLAINSSTESLSSTDSRRSRQTNFNTINNTN